MTVSSGFFNSVNHDRLYDAEQVSSMFDGIIIDGVYENFGEAFMITPYSESNSTVIVGTGRAWFDHTWIVNDSQFSMTLDPPNELLGRIDAIVLDIDRRSDVRKNSIIYVKGTEAVTPEIPTFIKEELHTQYPLCYITRHAEVNSPIKQEDINIRVGYYECPFVTGILEAQNLENLMAQLNAEFNTWWEGIKEALDENVATNLQQQIDELRAKVDSDSALVGLLTKSVYEKFKSGNYGLSVSSMKIQASTDDVSFRSEVVSTKQYPLVALLPDGKILSITHLSSSSGNDGALQVVLTGPNGVRSITNIPEAHVFYPYNLFAFMGGHFESYPVIVYIVLWANQGSGLGKYVKISISSSGTVQKTVTAFGEADSSHPDYAYGTSEHMESPTTNGKYFTYWWGTYRNSKKMSTAVVGPTGEFSYKKLTTPIDNPRKASNSGASGPCGYILGEQNYWVVKLTTSDPKKIDNTKYLKINEDDLSIELVNSAPPSNNYTPLCSAYIYSLSETNGFSKQEIVPRGSLSGTVSKISDYFLGASNSGEPLVEGGFVATLRGEDYVGIGPNGENIAIGTNGGSAVLKKKTSGVSGIDISKIVTYTPGMMDLDGSRYYLFYNYNSEGRYGAGTHTLATLYKIGG